MSTQFNCRKHLYFKLFKQLYATIQFSESSVSMTKTVQFQIIHFSISTQYKSKYSLNVKNIFSSYSVLIQLIQFSISTDFVYTQLHVKQFSFVQIQFQCQKTVLFEIIHSISMQFKCKYGLIVKKKILFQAIQFNQTIQFSIVSSI